VVAIVGRALSEAISLEVGGETMRLQPVKPRIEGTQPEAQSGSSLSLAAIDDPVELAQTMMQMYERDRFFRERIQDVNRTACGVLLQMSDIKSLVEAGQWMLALDVSARRRTTEKTHRLPLELFYGRIAGTDSTVIANQNPRDPPPGGQGRPHGDPGLCSQVC
jgi:hypothetical protein